MEKIKNIFSSMIESATLFVEKITANKIVTIIITIILVATPFIFLTTVYKAWFGPINFVYELKDELASWFFIFLAEFIGFLALLPAREKARLMQFICFLSALFTLLFDSYMFSNFLSIL